MSIICFNQLKIYRSDINSDQMIKLDILSQNGKIDIIENENTKNLELVLSEKDSSPIYLWCKLNDLNSQFLKLISGRICLKQQDPRLLINYWIEFIDAEQADNFTTIIANLNEIFATKIEPQTSDEKEEKKFSELCLLLEKSIKDGQVDDSIQIVRKMALNKLNVKIELAENIKKSDMEQEHQKLCQVNINLIKDKHKCKTVMKLQAHEFTVLDLKKQVFN